MALLANNRHELFVQALFQGKSSIQAYEDAGFVRNDNNASRLRNNEKVIARLTELHSRTVTSVNISQEWVIERLVEVVRICMSYEKIDSAGANKALHLIGLNHGMFVERKEVGKPGEFDGLTISSKRERMLGLAKQLGLDRISAKERLEFAGPVLDVEAE